MTPVLKFERGVDGREVVHLGAVRVGEVAPFPGDRIRATWRLWLPDFGRHVGADSLFIARSRVIGAVEEWLLRIGVFYPGQSVDVVLPAEQDADAEAAPRRSAAR